MPRCAKKGAGVGWGQGWWEDVFWAVPCHGGVTTKCGLLVDKRQMEYATSEVLCSTAHYKSSQTGHWLSLREWCYNRPVTGIGNAGFRASVQVHKYSCVYTLHPFTRTLLFMLLEVLC